MMNAQHMSTLLWLLLPVLLAVVAHEVAHGWMAKLLGDDSAHEAGRLTMNPMAHVDAIGTLLVPALSWLALGLVLAWARPVPVAYHRLTPAQGALVALAGPLANALMAGWWLSVAMLAQGWGATGVEHLARLGMLVNVVLAVLNLLPVPPLDGWQVAKGLVSCCATSRAARR